MSYARMSGDYSDLYLISTSWDTQLGEIYLWQCISCKLQEEHIYILTDGDNKWREEIGFPRVESYTYVGTYNMFSIKAVYRHLRHHIMRGHKVSIETIQRVVAEYYGVNVSRWQELWPRESWEFDICRFCKGVEDGVSSLTPYCDGECGSF